MKYTTNIDTLSALLDRLISENIKLYFFQKDNLTDNIEHQKGGSECGMFSIYFLDKCLKNVGFSNFINNKKLNDDLVFKYRDKYFVKS